MSERKRQMIVDTAQIWYDAAKNPTPDCSAVMGLSNALNHTENALCAVLEEPTGEYAQNLRRRLRTLRAES